MAYFGQYLTYSKVSQVHAFIIQNWQDIQQRPVHQLREHFLLFHCIYNTLQCFFPDLNKSHPILAYFRQFPKYSKVSQVHAFIIRKKAKHAVESYIPSERAFPPLSFHVLHFAVFLSRFEQFTSNFGLFWSISDIFKSEPSSRLHNSKLARHTAETCTPS